ncbi:MAG: IPTL-CTERM sorting domain-containing protein, partial [Desulfosalsimonadaceae bacterium]
FLETDDNANTLYTAGDGSSNTGDTYSFGATGSSERAFGTLLSGSLVSTVGASFINDTGQMISSLLITYAGEQWRQGAVRIETDRLDFQYSTDATALNTGSWSDVNELDFSTVDTSGSAGSRDGNTLRQTVGFTITGLSIASGGTFWIRWNDFNILSNDDGLAIDDFSLVVVAAPTATTQAATGMDTVSATLNGLVNANGSDTAVAFEYGLDTSYGNTATADQSPVTGSGNVAVSAALTGLTPGTTYHFRLVAENDAGTTYGDDLTFTTTATATIPTLSEWGIILMSLMLAGSAFCMIRRRTA